MKKHTALITGANGGIGRAICTIFQDAGWRIIASDQTQTNTSPANTFLPIDLRLLCRDSNYQVEKLKELRNVLGETGLHALINNAACQIVTSVENLTINDWHNSLDVNLLAPFLLTQCLLPELQETQGTVINIASIHAQLTKPLFTSYATSKAALLGLTRSLAVELGDRIQVSAICPAAIATPMLKAGFENNPHGLDRLSDFHPTSCIGRPEEVAQAALYLAQAKGSFLNGTVIGLDGGIASRLHDPD